MIKILSPIMDNDDLAKLRNISDRRVPVRDASDVLQSVRRRRRACAARCTICSTRQRSRYESGATILILSDRQIDKDYAPIPSLLATSGLHHHLVREGSRTKATLIVESGDAREVHHYCFADRLWRYRRSIRIWRSRRWTI